MAVTATAVATRPVEPLRGTAGALVFRSDVLCPWVPIPRRIVDAEVVLCAGAEPGFGWSPWFGPLDEFPVSSLLALEAVQAARTQSEAAAERLDLELRKAFFVRSRCITMLNEVLAAARSCDLDVVVPEVVSDDPSTVRDLVAQAAGSFIEEGLHDSRG